MPKRSRARIRPLQRRSSAMVGEPRPDWVDRLASHITPLSNGCWQYGKNLEEYKFAIGPDGRTHHAHRVVYEVLIGPIPEDHHLHHECENPGCVNPAHLLPLTPGDHAHRHAEMRKAS